MEDIFTNLENIGKYIQFLIKNKEWFCKKDITIYFNDNTVKNITELKKSLYLIGFLVNCDIEKSKTNIELENLKKGYKELETQKKGLEKELGSCKTSNEENEREITHLRGQIHDMVQRAENPDKSQSINAAYDISKFEQSCRTFCNTLCDNFPNGKSTTETLEELKKFLEDSFDPRFQKSSEYENTKKKLQEQYPEIITTIESFVRELTDLEKGKKIFDEYFLLEWNEEWSKDRKIECYKIKYDVSVNNDDEMENPVECKGTRMYCDSKEKDNKESRQGFLFPGLCTKSKNSDQYILRIPPICYDGLFLIPETQCGEVGKVQTQEVPQEQEVQQEQEIQQKQEVQQEQDSDE